MPNETLTEAFTNIANAIRSACNDLSKQTTYTPQAMAEKVSIMQPVVTVSRTRREFMQKLNGVHTFNLIIYNPFELILPLMYEYSEGIALYFATTPLDLSRVVYFILQSPPSEITDDSYDILHFYEQFHESEDVVPYYDNVKQYQDVIIKELSWLKDASIYGEFGESEKTAYEWLLDQLFAYTDNNEEIYWRDILPASSELTWVDDSGGGSDDGASE